MISPCPCVFFNGLCGISYRFLPCKVWAQRDHVVLVASFAVLLAVTVADRLLKDASGATVNDVVMSVVAGCIRRYSEANGDSTSLQG